MTEQDAKTKWCPFARHTAIAARREDGTPTTIVNVNRDPDHFMEGNLAGAPVMNCIASSCMAWREVVETAVYSKSNGARVLPGHIVLRDSTEKRREVVGGFCGLAGRPE